MCARHLDKEKTWPRLQTHAPGELGFISLGHLGVRMASRLARAGHQLVVFIADAAQLEQLAGTVRSQPVRRVTIGQSAGPLGGGRPTVGGVSPRALPVMWLAERDDIARGR